MRRWLRVWWHEEDGQELLEYALLLALIVLAAASIFGTGNDAIKGIVNTSTSQIEAGNRLISGS